MRILLTGGAGFIGSPAITKARERLGCEPRVSWQEALAELAAWAKTAPFADHFERAQREIEARGLVR